MPKINIQRQRSTSELIEKDDSFSLRITNLRILAIEMYHVVHSVSPEIMKEVFKFRQDSRYNLWSPIVNTVYNGSETVLFMGPKIWELNPTQIKKLISMNDFKKAIKKWKPASCLFLADLYTPCLF